MFNSARIRLTAWYLIIIALISFFFSVAIYRVLTSELNRIESMQRIRIEREIPDRPRPFFLDPLVVAETKRRIFLMLSAANVIILAGSAVAGYYLAGRTLSPIKEMVEEQDRFISDASHELRTPITVLKSEIEVGLRDKKLSLVDAKKLLVSNLEEANNLQVLSDDLIKLSRYQQWQNGFIPTKVSLKTVVGTAIKRVDVLAKRKQINLVDEITKMTLWGEQSSLIELLVILLDNAIKYSPRSSKVTVLTQKTDGHVILKVIDQGMGIAKKDLPHLFDRFYRVNTARSRQVNQQVEGYGLGLSIAQEIVKRHHGAIKVESKLGKGTTFSVSLQVGHLN